jgi:hypothetical protein
VEIGFAAPLRRPGSVRGEMLLCTSNRRSKAGRSAGNAEVGIPTTQPILGAQMKIPPTIEPIAHISPYRRIDPSHPGRKRVITLDEWQASGSTRKPDPAIYSYDERNRRWVLKEDVRE